MTAAAPARKGPQAEETEFRRLAREMQAANGLDPIPPDQYLYFLGKKEPPLQRLLALVRSLTIRRGRRSAYCVDEHGREVKMLHLEKLLGMDHGNFMRAWKEAIARGLVRRDDQTHPHRIYLCGNVKESVGYGGEETVDSVCTDTLRYLSPTQRKVYDGWRKEQQVRFYADFDHSVKYKHQLEKEAIALARQIGDRALDQVFAAYALPKTRLATAPPEAKLLQLSLVSVAMESVQTPSVPTLSRESVRTTESESVPAAPSLLSLENRERVPGSVGQSTEEPTDRPTPIDAVRNLLRNEWGAKLPGERATAPLCQQITEALAGAPLALLRNRMIQRIEKAGSFGFALVLARDIGEQWREDAAKRAKAERAREEHAVANVGQNRLLWQETLDDPQASAEEKRLAAEFLGRAQKAKATGGGQ